MEDLEITGKKKTSGLAFSINSILSETSHTNCGDNVKSVEKHSTSSIDEEERCLSEQENNDNGEDDLDDDCDDEEYSESNYEIETEQEIETENENSQGMDENGLSTESKLSNKTKNNAVEQTPSSTSNEELFLNYCRSYGIENVNLNQPESNKYLLKMLLNPQTTSSMYSSLFSTLFSSLNNTNGDFLIANNTIEQPKLILDNDDEKNMNSSPIFQKRIGHPYQNRNPPKRKKPRTSFNRPQIVELEKRFVKQKYLASNERSSLAKSLKMTDAQVKTWFQNRRTKWRRQNVEEKEAQRQAANKLMISLNLHHQQNPITSGISETQYKQSIQNQIAFQNSLSTLTTALSAAGNVIPLAIENNNRNANPLNKLMDLAFKVDTSNSSNLKAD